jgi:hypothetical protein
VSLDGWFGRVRDSIRLPPGVLVQYNPNWRAASMKAIEFWSTWNPDQTLTVPTSVLDAIPVGQTVRVLILVPEGDADREWEQSAAEEFGRGYGDSDAIYDQLSTG